MRITMWKGCVQHFGLQHQVVVFLFLGHTLWVFLWSYCVHGFVNLLWTWLFSFEYLSMYVSVLSCTDEEAKWSWWEMHKYSSPVFIPGIQCPKILLPHLSSLSDLDQDPRSLLKFCTNRIIYKNSFSIECIHAHIDVYTCRQNTYVNNMKYGQFHSI